MNSYKKGLLAMCAVGILVFGAIAVPPAFSPPVAAAAISGPTSTVNTTMATTALPPVTISITAASGTPVAVIRSSAQAAARAAAASRASATPKITPTGSTAGTTTLPKGSAALCGAPANPYGYNYCGRGGQQSTPPADLCSYFQCIPYFSHGKGHLAECRDTMVSMSGGRRGACSYHGGVLRAVTG